MLPSEEIRNKINIVDLVGEYVQLKKAGVNWRAVCPFHQERTPSFTVSPAKQIWHCFGCFPPGQKVKTPFGLHNIDELDENHFVYSGSGQIRKILATHKRDYKGQLVHVQTRKLGGTVSMTSDHHLRVLRPKTKHYRKTKQFYRRCREALQKGLAKDSAAAAKLHGNLLEFTAGELQTDDFVFYPINTAVNDIRDLNLKDYLTKSYTFGPRPSGIPYRVKVNDDLLKLLGYWIAEGSSHRAYIRFSLGSHEEEFAKEIVDLISKIFGLNAKIHRRSANSGKTGLEITACHAYLANIFENLCGKGAADKHIPFVFQELPYQTQQILLHAIHKGDGTDYVANRSIKIHKSLTTISRILEEQVVDILLRNGFYPSLQITKKKIDRFGVNHREAYRVKWSEEARPQHNFVYEEAGSRYWLLPVKAVAKSKYSGPVYNLTVEKDHTYIATNFAVANCGLGGDIFEFIKQIEGVDFPEALQILAPRAGVVLSRQTANYQKEKDAKKALYEINELAAKYYAKILADSPLALAARNYLVDRGFAKETVLKWQIGWAPEDYHIFENFISSRGYQKKEALAAGLLSEKDGRFFDRFHGRIMFPLHDAHGRVVGFTGRVLVEKDEVGKYVNSPETAIYHKGELLYGLHFAKNEIRRRNEAVVVEGNVDVITAHEAGFANVVGSSGTALTEAQLASLKRFTDNASFAFDVDEAGVAAARRAVETALKFGLNVKIINLPRELGKDPDEVIRKNPAAWEEQVKGAQNFLDFYFDKTFAIMDLTSSTGKKQALAELLPLLVLLPDPVDRIHYLQILARETNVDEAILLEKIKGARDQTKPAAGRSEARFGKSKREILERRVLGFLLRYGKQTTSAWDDLGVDDFSVMVLRAIYELAAPAFRQKDFDWKKLASSRPELASEIELLVFAVDNELELLGLSDLEQVKRQFVGRLKLETLKQKMKDLTARIARAESRQAYEEVKTLTGEFNNLTRELAKYHAA